MPLSSKTTRPRTFHHEALAWRTAVQNNGGSVRATTLRAVSNFCTAINDAGIRSKFLRLNLVCGNDLAAARTPLYRGASASGTQYGSTADTNIGPFTSADFSDATGITGNGISKAFDTTLTIGTLQTAGLDQDNCHASVYTRGSNHGDVFGGGDSANYWGIGNYGILLSAGENGWWQEDAFSGSNDGRRVTSTDSSAGHKYGQEYALSMQYWTNGLNSSGGVNSGWPNGYNEGDETPIYFCGRWESFPNFEDTPVISPYYASGSLAAYSVGTPLGGETSIARFYKAMQAFQTEMRRNV